MNWKDIFEFTPSQASLAKRILGIVLILIGLVALVTPLTPGSWLIFFGFGIWGIRLTFWDKWKEKWNNRKSKGTPK